MVYRAVVRDNSDHQRKSSMKRAVVPAPKLTIKLPAEGAGVFGTVEVRVLVDPEESSHVVRIQRRLNDGAWETVRTDRSSPVYSYFEDLSTVPVGQRSSTGPSFGNRTVPGWSVRSVRFTG